MYSFHFCQLFSRYNFLTIHEHFFCKFEFTNFRFALILFGLFVQGKQLISLRIMLNLKIASIKTLRRNFFCGWFNREKEIWSWFKFKNKKEERKNDFWGGEKIKWRGSSNVWRLSSVLTLVCVHHKLALILGMKTTIWNQNLCRNWPVNLMTSWVRPLSKCVR